MGKNTMFELLKEGLIEAIEYERGNKKFREKTIIIPEAPKKYSSNDIKKLRAKLNFSQKAFASWLNVSLNTIQAWEQGTRTPSHCALRLLEIFDDKFSVIEEIFDEKPSKKEPLKKRKNSTVEIFSYPTKVPMAAESK